MTNAIEMPIHNSDKRVLVDFKQFTKLARYTWYASGNYVYRYDYKDGKQNTVYLHREITNCPSHLVVNHIDHNTYNCTEANLECISRQANSHDRRSKNVYKGVYKAKSNKYYAKIRNNNKTLTSDLYDTPEEAATVYDLLSILYYGSNAKNNNLI